MYFADNNIAILSKTLKQTQIAPRPSPNSAPGMYDHWPSSSHAPRSPV